jgi:DNA-binding NtrC family response regulator
MKLKVIVVEDDDHLRGALQAATLEGYSAIAVSSAEAALDQMQEAQFDILVTDVNLPAMTDSIAATGVESSARHVAIVMTAFGTIDVAVEAMKRGARLSG